jgi:hypothetical protein
MAVDLGTRLTLPVGYSSWGIATAREEEKDNSISLAILQINHRII